MATAKTKPNCYCSDCGTNGFRRSELNAWFMCESCAAKIPDLSRLDPAIVRRHSSAKTARKELRGLWAGSGGYWESIKDQVNIVTDDDPNGGPPKVDGAATNGTRPRSRKAEGKPPSPWEQYQADVLASRGPTDGDKLLFLTLARRYADYETGGDCAPRQAELAADLGRTVKWVSNHLRRLKTLGLVEVIPLRSRRGRRGWAQNLVRFVGHGFESPIELGDKLDYLEPSRTPRPSTVRDGGGQFRKG